MTVVPQGLTKARIAILTDRFHLTPRDILQLTDRQMIEVYFHERDKDGAIKVPMPSVENMALSPEEELARLQVLKLIMEDADFNRMTEEVARKHGEAGSESRK